MANHDDILQELRELNSQLASWDRENVFGVPVDYFAGLASQIMSKVRALEADPKVELGHLSPFLDNISRQMPFQVPAGYFTGLEKKLELVMAGDTDQGAAAELESLSPLLAGLKNKDTYTIPQGYFDKPKMAAKPEEPKAKVISITGRKWFRYAAAALVIGFIATIGFVLLNRGSGTVDPADKSYAWVKKNMKKVSTDDITKFVELAGAGAPDVVKTETKDEIMNSLLNDVSDKEIQDFLNETQVAEAEPGDDLILN